MPSLSMESLNPLATILASVAAVRHPEWLETATSGDDGDLCIQIPAPVASDLSCGLWLATEFGEINVGFDDYHRHLGDLGAPDGGVSQWAQFAADGVDFAESVLADRIASLSWYDSERLRATGHAETDRLGEIIRAGFRVRIRSWSGRFNKDIPQPIFYRIGLLKPRLSKVFRDR
jgi:hypothetical protein